MVSAHIRVGVSAQILCAAPCHIAEADAFPRPFPSYLFLHLRQPAGCTALTLLRPGRWGGRGALHKSSHRTAKLKGPVGSMLNNSQGNQGKPIGMTGSTQHI